eukprot:719065-Prymnesium_polylepis.2
MRPLPVRQGWGLVEFHNPASSIEAINNFSDMDLMGRKIFIREDREGGEGDTGGRGRGPGAIGELPPAKGKGKGKGKGRGKGAGRGPPMGEPEAEVTGGTALYVGNVRRPPHSRPCVTRRAPERWARCTPLPPGARPARRGVPHGRATCRTTSAHAGPCLGRAVWCNRRARART